MVLNCAYGDGRRLRVVNWTVARFVSWSIQDSRIKDLWCREGPPADAVLLDVILQKSSVLGASTVALVIEHPSFDPVRAGFAIPEQPVIYIDVSGAMDFVKKMPPPQLDM